MPFALTPKQAEAQRLLRGPQRHTLFYGGGRSGKTFLLVRAIATRALLVETSRHAILRLRANAARSAIGLDTLPKVMKLCYPGVHVEEHRQDGFYELPNGSQIWIGGLDDKSRVEKILGQEFATIYLNECSQIEHGSVLIARTRLAQVCEAFNPVTKQKYTLPQRMYYDLNPVGTKHWSYQEFVLGRDPSSSNELKNPERFAYMRINPVDNAANLSAETLQDFESLPERQRKRFFEGLYGTDLDGALWPPDIIAAARIDGIPSGDVSGIVRSGGMDNRLPEMRRVVVAVDPSGTSGKEESQSNSVGIVVAGKGVDGCAYVLADRTCDLPPAGWGRRAVDAYHEFDADAIIGETNYGGAMIAHVIKTTDSSANYIEVHASRGKWVRAEPISSLYDPANDKVRHVGRFPELEDQMENFTTSGYVGAKSPDRADALVWALTDLMLGDSFDLAAFIRANA